MTLRRVLFVSYVFPPTGGAGVQRVTKFVKYLPGCGWTPSVLVPSNPSVPASDTSLLSDIPEGTVIRRAQTLEPSYATKSLVSGGTATAAGGVTGGLGAAAKRLVRRAATSVLQPDPQVLWMPAAIREGRRLLSELPHDAIVATGPPFSCFLIGRALHRRSGLPLVLDYRDEWDLSNRFLENKRLGPLARRVQRALQRMAIRSAAAIVATTRHSAETLQRIARDADSPIEAVCIRNGFDPDDFPNVPNAPRADPSTCRLVYSGTLWNLTSIEPLVDACCRLSSQEPQVAARIELVVAGRRTGDQQAILGRLANTRVRLVEHPYVDHQAALGLVRSADLLCALLTDAPGAERVLPGKVFEYMASGRPVLAIAPRGELWEVLESYPSAHSFEPADIGGITDFLSRCVRTHQGAATAVTGSWDSSPFERRSQAGQLSAVLAAVAAGSSPVAPTARPPASSRQEVTR
jgi:glycosyltransferase involved in cell wall biosynthesis